MLGMKPVPWSSIESWNCTNCGECCKRFIVYLAPHEQLAISRAYGSEFTIPCVRGFYLPKKLDDSCAFLYSALNRRTCAIQHLKPLACKLWPFEVYTRAKYGRPNEASFTFRGSEFFVYLNPACHGLTYGVPSPRMTSQTVPEFVEIALGMRSQQQFSTSPLPFCVLPVVRRYV